MEDFWYIYHFKDLIKEPTCLKIKLLEKFPRKASLEAGLSDFHKINKSQKCSIQNKSMTLCFTETIRRMTVRYFGE